jgi:hemoglobin-like flavoprotein
MGGAVSTKKTNYRLGDIQSVVNTMMPLYYHKVEPAAHHVQEARSHWNLILEGTAPALCSLRKQHGFEMTSFCEGEGTTIFKLEFIKRFFDIAPTVKPFFSKSVIENPVWVIDFVDLCLTQLEDVKAFRAKMVNLAKMHIRIGVSAIQYGVIGDVLFWTLDRCTGRFPNEVEVAWKVLFSSMLRIIVPIAVHHEVNNNNAPRQQVAKSLCAVANSVHMNVSASFENSVLDEKSFELTADPRSYESNGPRSGLMPTLYSGEIDHNDGEQDLTGAITPAENLTVNRSSSPETEIPA